MKCEKCEQEMIKGMLAADSIHWIAANKGNGVLNKIFNPGFGADFVWAWKCESCKKITLYSE